MGETIYSTFKSLSSYVKVNPNKISIDNLAFKFHYRATFLILLVFTLLVTSRQYIGEHIKCIADRAIPEHVINSFCFFTSTFTIVRHYNESLLAIGALPHPGVGPQLPDDNTKHHAYYQWVPFVLFGQAMMFYFPHVLWRKWEGGRIKALVDGLRIIQLSRHNKKQQELRLSGNFVIPSQDTVDSRIYVIKNEFYKHIKINKSFARHLIIAEWLNVINLILQIKLTDMFLANQFMTLGPEFIRDNFTGEMDVLDFVFPKVTKCNFYKYGQSGSVQRHDALCIMALNIINEKIYVILWFWFVLMVIVSIGAFIWRLVTLMLYGSVGFNKFVFSTISFRRINTQDLIVITAHITFADWLFLYYLGKNMDSFLFASLLGDLANEFRNHYSQEHRRLLRDVVSVEDNEKELNIDTIDGEDVVDLRRKQ